VTRRSAPAQADVLVLGAGLNGCLAARDLARAGRRTLVVAPAPDHGEACLGHVPSGPALSYAAAIARWGRPGARELWELQRECHSALRALLEEWGRSFAYQEVGGFTLAMDRPEGLALAESEDLLREDGFTGEFLDGYMLEARFAVRNFAAAYWAASEAELDGEALAAAARAAAREAGAAWREARVERLEVSAKGVVAVTPEGRLRAPVAVLASVDASALVPWLRERIDKQERHGIRLQVREAFPVPTPARTEGGRARWTTAAGELGLEVAEADPGEFAARHLPDLTGPRAAAWSRPAGRSRDGLPWVGPLPDLPLVAALAGPDLAWVPLASRWAVSSLLGGRDATPPRLRAARTASDMLTG
jgi:glycine/D-amino acid oxidase-like deaminating enzyme